MASKFGIDIVVIENPMGSSYGRAVSAFAVVQEVRKAKKWPRMGATRRRVAGDSSPSRLGAIQRQIAVVSIFLLWRSETASDHGVTGQPRRTGSMPGA